jgi:nucleoside-diphosphate kinase
VKVCRTMLGATSPSDSLPGTIRGDMALSIERNVCHGSDSVQAAEHEIGLWFPEGVQEYSTHSSSWLSG